MHKSLTFNGVRKPWLYLLEGRSKAPFAPIRNNLLKIPGMPGAHISGSSVDALYINQPVGFFVESDEHALQLKDELAEWLITDSVMELQFDDEPGRIYFAKIEGTLEDFERFVNQRTGVIQFICPDPFAYGEEIEESHESNGITLNIDSTMEVEPLIELTTKEKTTFAMLSNANDEYNLIGVPADDDIEIVETRQPILKENGETLDTWTTSNTEVDTRFNDISGNMIYDEIGIIAQSYGTGDKMHGPAMIKEIDPIQDFEIETMFDIITTRPADNYRMEVYFFDENMEMLGKMGINDKNRFLRQRIGLGRVGVYDGKGVRYAIGSHNYNYDDLGETSPMYLRVKREGNLYTFYISELRNSKHTSTLTETYLDTSGEYAGKLKYVQIFLGSWQDRTRPWRNRVLYLNVYELKQQEEDQTPYLLDVGDVVTFDHANGDILINGEDAMRHKAFGANFFQLYPGYNQLIVSPSDSFDTYIKWRNKYR